MNKKIIIFVFGMIGIQLNSQEYKNLNCSYYYDEESKDEIYYLITLDEKDIYNEQLERFVQEFVQLEINFEKDMYESCPVFTMIFYLLIDENGRVERCGIYQKKEVEYSYKEKILVEKMREILKRYEFPPPSCSGTPVRAITFLTLRF